jgi:hypothetical protein
VGRSRPQASGLSRLFGPDLSPTAPADASGRTAPVAAPAGRRKRKSFPNRRSRRPVPYPAPQDNDLVLGRPPGRWFKWIYDLGWPLQVAVGLILRAGPAPCPRPCRGAAEQTRPGPQIREDPNHPQRSACRPSWGAPAEPQRRESAEESSNPKLGGVSCRRCKATQPTRDPGRSWIPSSRGKSYSLL